MLRRVIREPMVQFLIVGALLFAAYEATVDDDAVEPSTGTIVIGGGEIQFLRAQFEKLWGRPPTDSELAPLVREYIREEVLYREGVAMGLAEDDIIIRRRIAQKMRFLIGDLAVPANPGDETLKAYLDANREKYLDPPRLTFTHVYFNIDRRGEKARADAEAAIAALGDRKRGPEFGDPFALSTDYTGKTVREVDQTFGPGFGERLIAGPVEQWFGPVASAYGLHLVRVLERTEPRMPDFGALRDILVRDYTFEARQNANAAALERLTERYRIVFDGAWRPPGHQVGELAPGAEPAGKR